MLALMISVFLSSCPVQGDGNTRIIEEGGAGSYKAVAVTPRDCPGTTLYFPADLKAAAAKTTLPLVLFEGEGGPKYEKYLNEIASFGYVVADIGRADPGRALEAVKASEALRDMPAGDLPLAVVSAAGPATALPPGDLRTVVYVHSSQPAPDLPVLYVAGGLDADAYLRIQKDYDASDGHFAAVATYPAGAEGTFNDAFGGSYSMITLQWLEWLLKDKPWSRTIFTGEECICFYTGWGIQYKNEDIVINDNQ
jgi:hypothetical protein